MNIIKAFEKSMQEYEGIQKSKHWKKFDARKHLYTEENLKNFRNNKLSDGLDDKYSLEEQKKIYQDLVAELGTEYVHSNLTAVNIGNSPDYFKLGKLVVDGGQNFHIKWLSELEKYIFSKKKINYICEIGGGYGSLAQKIRSKFNCRYILIDLPEANLLSSYYLSKHFPKLKFLLCDEIESRFISKEQIDKYDFIIIPPWYHLNKDLKIDLFINTRSMMEMNFDIVKKYFNLIQTNISFGGFFLNINRYYKDSVGYPIELWKYPYDDKWKVIVSKTSWKQPHIHELITQRQTEKADIQKELVHIEAMGQTFKSRGIWRTIKNKINYYLYQYEVR